MGKKTQYKFTVPEFSLMILGAKDYDYQYRNAISYANYEVDTPALVKAAKAWVSKNTDYNTKIMFSMSDAYYTSIGKFCFIMLKGGQFDEKHMVSIHKRLKEIYEKAQEQYQESKETKEAEKESSPAKKMGIQDHLRNRASQVAEQIDIKLDMFAEDPKANSLKDFDVEAYLKDEDIKAGHYRYIIEFYKNDLAEIIEVLEGKDEDLSAAWKHRTKKQMIELKDFLQKIIDVSELMKGKTSSEPRKKRAIDKAKRVSKIAYKEMCPINKVESINPIKIIGATSLWVFNTKTRKLGHYMSVDDDGFDVTGTSIKNFRTGCKESILLKSADIDIKKFHTLSENVRNKRFDALKSVKTDLKGRINEHVVLLCVE